MTNKPSSTDRTPYCPNCGEVCLDAWHREARPVRDDELIAELTDEATRLSGSSLGNGCPDCGIASNLASKAADRITDLRTENGELRQIIAALGYCTLDASIEFLRLIPAEVKALQARLERYRAALEHIAEEGDSETSAVRQVEGCKEIAHTALGDTHEG